MPGGRDRQYANVAEKQQAYRDRLKLKQISQADLERGEALVAAQVRGDRKAQAHKLEGYEVRVQRAITELAQGEKASGEIKLRASIIRALAILKGEVI